MPSGPRSAARSHVRRSIEQRSHQAWASLPSTTSTSIASADSHATPLTSTSAGTAIGWEALSWRRSSDHSRSPPGRAVGEEQIVLVGRPPRRSGELRSAQDRRGIEPSVHDVEEPRLAVRPLLAGRPEHDDAVRAHPDLVGARAQVVDDPRLGGPRVADVVGLVAGHVDAPVVVDPRDVEAGVTALRLLGDGEDPGLLPGLDRPEDDPRVRPVRGDRPRGPAAVRADRGVAGGVGVEHASAAVECDLDDAAPVVQAQSHPAAVAQAHQVPGPFAHHVGERRRVAHREVGHRSWAVVALRGRRVGTQRVGAERDASADDGEHQGGSRRHGGAAAACVPASARTQRVQVDGRDGGVLGRLVQRARDLGVGAHASPPSGAVTSVRRSDFSASDAWDLTVPREQPRTRAISSSDRSS